MSKYTPNLHPRIPYDTWQAIRGRDGGNSGGGGEGGGSGCRGCILLLLLLLALPALISFFGSAILGSGSRTTPNTASPQTPSSQVIQPSGSSQSAPSVAAANPSKPWQGTWKGIAHHAGQQPFDASMKLMQANPNDLDSISGTIQYQGGQCFGTLTETGRAGQTILLREDEPDQCLGAEWEFTLDTSGNALTAKATFIQFGYGNIEIDFVRTAT